MACAGLAVMLLSAAAPADEVPLSVGATVLLKVLTYDASFDGRGSGDFVVLVPHAPDRKAEADVAMEALAPLTKSKLKARALSFVPVRAAELAGAIETKRASAILLLRGSSSDLIAEAARLGKSARVYTLGASEDSVQNGVALGVTVKDSKPQVLINVAQSRAEGMDFPQSILKLARVVK